MIIFLKYKIENRAINLRLTHENDMCNIGNLNINTGLIHRYSIFSFSFTYSIWKIWSYLQKIITI